MRKLIAVIAMLALPAVAGAPLKVFIDGELVGTVGEQGITYDLAADEIHIQTNEIVVGCSQSRVFYDEFEIQ